LLAVVAVLAYVWAVRSGQLDDLETPGVRLLIDDDEARGAEPLPSPEEP
jgi:cbb3-type cytochrome oxidase maturation protein